MIRQQAHDGQIMKKRLFMSLIVAALLLSLGCIPSINPYYSKDTRSPKKDFEGDFTQNEGAEKWQVEAAGNTYKIVHTDDDGNEGKFLGVLFTVDDTLFLDLEPRKMFSTENTLYRYHVMPMHTLFKIVLDESGFTLVPSNPEWVKKYLKVNPTEVPHVMKDNLPILTGSTEQLQEFIASHHLSDDFFSKGTKFNRD